MHRVAAALVALAAFAGLAMQFNATFASTGSITETLWILLRFFTILTNFLVALIFTVVALGRRVSPFLLGGLTLAILLVGIVYTLLLRGLVELSGGALIADAILHTMVPVLVPLYWLAFAPKGKLRWTAPLLWMFYPLAYFAYAMIRGMVEQRFAYPFIDVGKHGLAQVLVTAAVIAACFVVGGLGLVGLDSLLSRNRRSRTVQ